MSQLININDWIQSFYSKDFYKNIFKSSSKKSLIHLLIIGFLTGIICYFTIFNTSMNKAYLFGQILTGHQPQDIDPQDEFVVMANILKEQIPVIKIVNEKLTIDSKDPLYIVNNAQHPILIIDINNQIKEFSEPSIIAMVKDKKIILNSTNKKELQHMNQEYKLDEFLKNYDGETIDNVFLGSLLQEKALEIKHHKTKLIIITIMIAVTLIFSTVACISFSVGIFLNFLNKKNEYKNIFNIVAFAFTPAFIYQALLIMTPMNYIANLGGIAFFAIFAVYIIFGITSVYKKK